MSPSNLAHFFILSLRAFFYSQFPLRDDDFLPVINGNIRGSIGF